MSTKFEVGDLVMLNLDYKNTFTIGHMLRKFDKNAMFTISTCGTYEYGNTVYEIEEEGFSFEGRWLLDLGKLSKEEFELSEELFIV